MTSITKPVKHSDLLDAIVVAAGGASSVTRSMERTPAARAMRPLKILLAEDNAVNQTVILGMLADQPHQITVVDNGRDAVRLVLQSLGEGATTARAKFDLVLMDVQMPGMSGIEATDAIRKAERDSNTHVPIVAMTAHAMSGDRERFLAAGMDDYVAKPLRIEEVLATLERVAGGQSSVLDAAGAPDVSPVTHETPAAQPIAELDVAAILSGLGGSRALLGDVIDVFLKDAPQRIADARAALDRGDAGAVAAEAHALKSMVGLFTMAEPFAAARELEAIGKRGDLLAAAEGMTTLDRTIAALADRLRALRLDLQK